MKNAIFNNFDADERASFIRTYTDSAERWLRHLVDLTLRPIMGQHYITQGPWKKDLIRRVVDKIQTQPTQLQREIDATTFDQLIDMICHPDHWRNFRDGLATAYPDGVEEARTFLTRLQDIRNGVAHLRPCSIRQMEQALCYSNDVAESVKQHLQATGMSKEFYVPTFVSYSDSLGNYGNLPASEWHYRAIDLSNLHHKRLYPRDVLTIDVDVDSSFDQESYDVIWYIKTHPSWRGEESKAIITLTEEHISQRIEIQFKLKTTNSWHKESGGFDDILDLYYRVLPTPP